jgi:septal ring factor EnvC (AmiA/AmiB activator)
MEEKKLTDEEIVKALEIGSKCCEHNYLEYWELVRACQNGLDLIHRLQDDYSKLKEKYVKVLDLNEKVIAEQKAEIERLTEENSKLRVEIVSILNENAELQKQMDELKKPIGKFKDQTALKKAYESLEKEFTKRSQRLKELQKNNDDLVEDLANMTIYPEEAVKRIRAQAVKDTAKEIFETIFYDCWAIKDENGHRIFNEGKIKDFAKKCYGVEVE